MLFCRRNFMANKKFDEKEMGISPDDKPINDKKFLDPSQKKSPIPTPPKLGIGYQGLTEWKKDVEDGYGKRYRGGIWYWKPNDTDPDYVFYIYDEWTRACLSEPYRGEIKIYFIPMREFPVESFFHYLVQKKGEGYPIDSGKFKELQAEAEKLKNNYDELRRVYKSYIRKAERIEKEQGQQIQREFHPEYMDAVFEADYREFVRIGMILVTLSAQGP